jgi:hypothetical protein
VVCECSLFRLKLDENEEPKNDDKRGLWVDLLEKGAVWTTGVVCAG